MDNNVQMKMQSSSSTLSSTTIPSSSSSSSSTTTTTTSSTTMSASSSSSSSSSSWWSAEQVSLTCVSFLIGKSSGKSYTSLSKNKDIIIINNDDCKENHHHHHHHNVSSLSISSWFGIFVVGFIVGGQCTIDGGWHSMFHKLEEYVVFIYTALIICYITILLLAEPLEYIYRWFIIIITTQQQQQQPQKKEKTMQLKKLSSLINNTTETTTPLKEATTTSTKGNISATHVQQEQEHQHHHQQQPFNLSGVYKLVENKGFEEFLAVQGVPWALRRAANQVRPVHRIIHQGSKITIKIEGIIESQTTYYIGGPPVETDVRGRIFQDVVQYLGNIQEQQQEQDEQITITASTSTTATTKPMNKHNNKNNNNDTKTIRSTTKQSIPIVGIRVSKTAITENYDVTVQREWSPDMQQITMTSRATFRDGRDSVQCVQKFKRIG